LEKVRGPLEETDIQKTIIFFGKSQGAFGRDRHIEDNNILLSSICLSLPKAP
jgi:hypothetical protein